MHRWIVRAALVLATTAPAPVRAQARPGPVELPARLIAGRFYVYPVTERGDTLTLFTDTGGGLWLAADAVARLGLPTQVTGVQGADTMRSVSLPAFRTGRSIPEPLGRQGRTLFVMPASQLQGLGSGWTGMLGQEWFYGRVWTFDYPRGKLLLHASSASVRRDPAHTVPLSFRKADGRAANGFPRIRIAVDGDSLDMLFDTGATARVPDSVVARLGGPRGERATSFITTEVFDRWRTRHPEWRVVAGADAAPGMAAIEVPRVSIAGFDVGPVWFTQRPDRSFHSYMAQWMDKRTDGALGGSALQYFRVTADYPNAVAVFERQ
jgi:hypothetical protein